jgi:hypothetical protein
MNISTKIKEAGKWVLVFTILTMLFSIIEELLLFVFYPQYNFYFYFLNVLLDTLYPSLVLFIITLLTIWWINRKYYYLVFPIILFLLMSSMFPLFPVLLLTMALLRFHGLIIMKMGAYFANTNFTIICYYIIYVVIPCLYYLGLTCLCNYIVKRKLGNKKYTS